MTTDSTITYRIDGPVAVIALDKPKLNTLDIAILDGLIAALKRAGDDDDIRAVILTSALEKAFCAGLDLAPVLDGGSAMMRALLQRLYIELFDVQHNLGKPSIAAVAGIARGGGMTLSLSCDVVVAADTASFGYPEFHVGILPGIHFTHLPRVVGRHKAFELLFTGNPISAKDAEAHGLVNYAVPRDRVMEKARELAMNLAEKSPVVMRIGRDSFMRANDYEYRRTIEYVVDTICHIIDTDDAQEGLNAFVEKRQPDWS